MNNKFARGSQWNKWDLHVHTPKSIVQHYGGDTKESWDKYIQDLESLPAEFKVLGINDYIYLDGFKKVMEYKNSGRLKNIELILPVIELRINKFASLGDEAWKKVNLHVIFSNKLDIETIDAQFLKAIQHSITISPDIEGIEFQGVATREYLEEIGRKIKALSSTENNSSDLKVGFWNINFDYKEVMKIVDGFFKGNCLTAIGKTEWDKMRWDGSAAEKKDVINTASFSFVSLEAYQDYEKHCNKLKAVSVRNYLLDCSDAHSFSSRNNEKDKIGNCSTWLKADLTFEGLKQVANDKTRIYIGDKPPLLIRKETNPTKFIRSLSIRKEKGSNLPEKWFEDFRLDLNSSMVAIIGNKGQGKSAISDIIGLLGNSSKYNDFSFLNKRKFRKPKPNRAEAFVGELEWEDGTIDTNNLNNNPEKTSVEKVKYLPQSYLETLCNEDVKDFETELRNVIFSHLSESDKLGKNNLGELIEFKTEIINKDISELKNRILNVNRQIIEYEKKESETYKKTLEEKLREKENELKAHNSVKPIAVETPSDPEVIKRNEVVSLRINNIRENIDNIQVQTDNAKKILSETKIDISEIEKTLQNISSFEKSFENLKTEINPVINKHGLNTDQIISINVNREKLQQLLEQKKEASKMVDKSLSNNEKNGLIDQKLKLQSEIKDLQQKLDEQSQSYQKYIDLNKEWEGKRIEILGSADKDGSIIYLKNEIKYIDEILASELGQLYKTRDLLTISLFKKKDEILEQYKKLFSPITGFIKNYGKLLSDYSIQLDVDLKIVGFVEKFFDHVSLGSKGSFIGNPSGLDRLHQILEEHSLKTGEGVVEFLNTLIKNLKIDQRDDQLQAKREILDQLKKGYSVFDLYSYLFSLEYLMPEYKLKLGDKNLSELSPGERGALLLIFYLSLDQNDIPLIIDQPEENLDNQSVFTILVNFIIDTKERRQIIIVTHNPNLAVACNAEQIVHVSMQKDNLNKITLISGSLENEKLNDSVLNILEGTFPALNTRTKTYNVFKRTK